MDCSLPGSSAHGIFQARVLEWGAIAFSKAMIRGLQMDIDTWKDGASELSEIFQERICFHANKLSTAFALPWYTESTKGSRKCNLKNYHPTPPLLKLGCSSQCTHHRSYVRLHFTGEQLRGTQERCGGHGVGRDVCVAPRGDSGDSVPLLFSAHRFKLTGGLQSCVLQKDLWVQAYLKRINLCQWKEMWADPFSSWTQDTTWLHLSNFTPVLLPPSSPGHAEGSAGF